MQILKKIDKQIGKIEIMRKGEKVRLYNPSEILVGREELNLPSGILVLKEDFYSSLYYGNSWELSVIDIEKTNGNYIVILSPDDRLIYRTRDCEWASTGMTFLINENVLVTRWVPLNNEENKDVISYDGTSNRTYDINRLPCILDLSSDNFKEYNYVYHNSNFIIAAEIIDGDERTYVFDHCLNPLYQVDGHFNFCLLVSELDLIYIVFNNSYNKYHLLAINYSDNENIDFWEEEIYGLSGIGKVGNLTPVSFYSNLLLFQTDENIAVLRCNFEHISSFAIPDKYKDAIKKTWGYDSEGNIDIISKLVKINERFFIECGYWYVGKCDIQYLDFMGNCVYSLDEIGSDLCVVKKNIATSCANEPSSLFGLCEKSFINLIPAIYDEIKSFSMDGHYYIVAKKNIPSNRSLIYCYVVKANPIYDRSHTIVNYTYDSSTLIDGEYDIDVQINTKYSEYYTVKFPNVGYGFDNCEDNESVPHENYLFSPFIVCTRPDKKKKVICNGFVSDYNYDDVCQLYLSPGLVNFYTQHNQKTLLRGFLFVASKNEEGILFWGMIDIKGNIVIDRKYKKIYNRNGWIIADNDIYVFRNNAFFYLKCVQNGVLIAWVDNYMAFELENSSILIIDRKGILYKKENDERIELSNNVYFDINNKCFVYVDEPDDVMEWDDGPSWAELGKDEEDYIINNGGDWILDVG